MTAIKPVSHAPAQFTPKKKPGGRSNLCTTGLVRGDFIYCRGAKYPLRART